VWVALFTVVNSGVGTGSRVSRLKCTDFVPVLLLIVVTLLRIQVFVDMI